MIKVCFLKKSFKMTFLLSGLALFSGCLDFGKKEEQKEGLLVINVLDKELYDDCHIPGSIQVDMMNVQKYVASYPKTTKIVIYCSNHACTASPWVAKKLTKDGFEHVWDYEPGMAGWYQEKLPVEGPAKAAYLHQSNPVLSHPAEGVDVISTQDLKKLIDEYSSKK
jgi:rhodanese-related sulfurtransferase